MGWPWQVVCLLVFLAKIKAARIGWQTDASKASSFEHIASIIEPYLKIYQTDKRMVSVVYYDLKDIVYQLLEIIVKPAVLDYFKIKSQTWNDIDLSKDNTLISAWKLDLGFGIDEDISNFEKDHPTNADQNISKFKSEAKCFIVAMISKLLEKSPLGSALLKSASVFDPDVQSRHEFKYSSSKFPW